MSINTQEVIMEINISDNIKKLRKEHRLTQEQLAEALAVTVGAVYKWESGKSVPEVGMLIQLANLFEGLLMHSSDLRCVTPVRTLSKKGSVSSNSERNTPLPLRKLKKRYFVIRTIFV